MRAKKGFTLVELCVVLAIMGIVSTLIMSYIVWTSNQTANSTNSSGLIYDLTSFQTGIDNWISKYDNFEYTYAVTETSVTVKKSSTAVDFITYNNGQITDKSNKVIFKGENFNSVSFSTVSESGKTVMIKATASFNDKAKNRVETQTFCYTIHSNIVKDRVVSPERPQSEGD